MLGIRREERRHASSILAPNIIDKHLVPSTTIATPSSVRKYHIASTALMLLHTPFPVGCRVPVLLWIREKLMVEVEEVVHVLECADWKVR